MFLNAETTQILTVTGGTVDLIIGGADGNLADSVACGAQAGDWCHVIGDGTYFYLLAGQGTWTPAG